MRPLVVTEHRLDIGGSQLQHGAGNQWFGAKIDDGRPKLRFIGDVIVAVVT